MARLRSQNDHKMITGLDHKIRLKMASLLSRKQCPGTSYPICLQDHVKFLSIYIDVLFPLSQLYTVLLQINFGNTAHLLEKAMATRTSTSTGEGNGNPHQYSCLENPRD